MSKLFTIGIDASRANQKEKTGVQWYAYHVINHMKSKVKSQKSKVEFILYSDEPLKGELANLPEGWSSKVLSWPPKRLWTQIRLSWEMLVHPPDVLFIPAHVFPLIHPKKTVMMVHDVAAMRFPESYNWFERWYSVWSAQYAVKHLWKVITPSECTRGELIKTLKHESVKAEEKIFAIQHGCDTRYCRKDTKDIEKILEKYSIKKPFLMTVGRLEEKKNTVRLIHAFEFLKKSYQLPVTRYRLLLIGSPGHGYEKVRDAIDASPFKNDIIELGWVNPEDTACFMNAAEVFVFPSLYEGFGLPILEAMACGTPVIAARGSSLEEVGGDAVLYVDPENVEDITAGIQRVIRDSVLRSELIQKGLERVKLFSWQKCAEETLNILLEE